MNLHLSLSDVSALKVLLKREKRLYKEHIEKLSFVHRDLKYEREYLSSLDKMYEECRKLEIKYEESLKN